MNKILASLLIALSISSFNTSYAQDYDLQVLEQKAQHNDVESLYNLGLMYKEGRGVSRDLNKAVDYLKKASDLNYAKAQYVLGLMYKDGEGVETNVAEAFNLLSKSAKQGNTEAKGLLELMQYLGKSVNHDYKDAIKWYQDKENNDSKMTLDSMYQDNNKIK